MELHHVKLAGVPYGCMYASLYALTGDDNLLKEEVLRDVSNIRHKLQALKRGWYIDAIYAHPKQTCGSAVWAWLWHYRPTMEGGYLPMLLSIPSPSYKGERHMVAMILDWEGKAWVSDCNQEDVVVFDDQQSFLASPYAEAYHVEQLTLASLDAHPFEDAEADLTVKGFV